MAKKIGEIEVTKLELHDKENVRKYFETMVYIEITGTHQGKTRVQKNRYCLCYPKDRSELQSKLRQIDGGKYDDPNFHNQFPMIRHIKAEAELCGTKDGGFDFKMTKLIAPQKNGPPNDEPMDEDTQYVESKNSNVLDEVLEEDDGREEDLDGLFDDYESVI